MTIQENLSKVKFISICDDKYKMKKDRYTVFINRVRNYGTIPQWEVKPNWDNGPHLDQFEYLENAKRCAINKINSAIRAS